MTKGLSPKEILIEEDSSNQGRKYVLALDVGTTTLRAHVYNHNAEIVGTGQDKIEIITPKPGRSELDPAVLWDRVKSVITAAVADASLTSKDISCMGITSQRNTFITWDKETGKYFHNFICWQDLRSSGLVKSWNDSILMSGFNKVAKFLFLLTRQKRYLAASVLRYKSAQVTLRLKYLIEHNEELKNRIEEKQVNFGTIDTWLLWKLTKGEVFATDYSSASATGMYDPFQMEWSTIVSWLIGLPLHILPPVKDTSGEIGRCSSDLFGSSIPITAMVADQQSAMFGQCCFDVGDVKCTMGTGTFIDCNTGSKPHASVAGLYPLIGWKIGSEVTYLAEGYASDTGVSMEWAHSLGLFAEVSRTAAMAEEVKDTGGVMFIPSFSGIQAPINDDKACTALIGITPNTSPCHIVRAILESIAFRFKLLHDTVLDETRTPLSKVIRCDGGVCQNSFLVQLVSDLTQCQMDRSSNSDMTSLGAAFLAGLAVGIWTEKKEFRRLRKTSKVYQPRVDVAQDYKIIFQSWQRALKRTLNWYQHD